jgi:hypothetical protein
VDFPEPVSPTKATILGYCRVGEFGKWLLDDDANSVNLGVSTNLVILSLPAFSLATPNHFVTSSLVKYSAVRLWAVPKAQLVMPSLKLWFWFSR